MLLFIFAGRQYNNRFKTLKKEVSRRATQTGIGTRSLHKAKKTLKRTPTGSLNKLSWYPNTQLGIVLNIVTTVPK